VILTKGIPLGISIDSSALTGSSNMFGVLKLARDSETPGWKASSKDDGAARRSNLALSKGARSWGSTTRSDHFKPGLSAADLIAITPMRSTSWRS